MPKPEPVPSSLVCSVCGLSWSDHKRKTIEECVRLLKVELTKRRAYHSQSGTNIAYPSAWGGTVSG